MRKITCFILCLITAGLMTGCNEGDGPKTRIAVQTTGVRDVIESQMAKEDGITEPATPEITATPTPDPLADYSAESLGAGGVDYDLTVLGSDMVYAEVYNMMIFPKEYMGKTIKVSGTFTVFYDEAYGKYHFACFVADAAACCQQGIEFILDGDKTYPSDYPQEGAEIVITGVFGTYEEDGNTYWALTNAGIG